MVLHLMDSDIFFRLDAPLIVQSAAIDRGELFGKEVRLFSKHGGLMEGIDLDYACFKCAIDEGPIGFQLIDAFDFHFALFMMSSFALDGNAPLSCQLA